MKKNLFVGMLVAAGMLFSTSCSRDNELDVVQSEGEAQVTFALDAEGGIATRVISDGLNADKLVYAVYDADNKLVTTIQPVTKTGVTFPTVEKITLAKGQTYTVVFWAQDADCNAYTVSVEDDGIKVAVDYTGDNNDETRDAFFKAETFKVVGDTNINVELTRPFAQINVGVTEADWNAAVASGITVEKSMVVIKNAATDINLLDGTVSGETEVTYELATIPATAGEVLKVDVNRNGTIEADEQFKYLSMSYILTDNDAERTTLESDGLQFTFTSGGEDIVFDEGLDAVPVQRNWRTNIIGKLLTGNIKFNIAIDKKYIDDYNKLYPDADDDQEQLVFNVTNAAELQTALNTAPNGAMIYFANDITGEVTAPQNPNVKITILGQGYSLKGAITVDGKSARYENAGLTIQSVNFTSDNSITVDANINLGKKGNSDTRYTNNVTVKDCTFSTTGTKEVVAIKSYEGGDYNLNIIDCTVDNTMHSLAQLKNIEKGLLIKDCVVKSVRGLCVNNCYYVEIDNCEIDVQKYAVRFGEGSAVDTYKETYFIKNSTLKSQNVEGDAAIVLRGTAANSILTIENTTIDAAEEIDNSATNATIIVDGVATVSSSSSMAAVINAGVTEIELTEGTYTIPAAAKNQTLTISGTEDTKIDVTSGLTYVNGADITFEGVTIQSTQAGAGYSNGFADMQYATFNDCVIDGTIGLDFSCEFNSCTFNITGNYYNVWTWGAGEVTFNECTFNCDGKALLVYANVLDNGTTHQTVNITGCKFYDLDDVNVEGKAAIEITNTYTPIRTYDVLIADTEVYNFSQTVPGADDFNATFGSVDDGNIGTEVWGNKCKLSNAYLNVEIDGVDVY